METSGGGLPTGPREPPATVIVVAVLLIAVGGLWLLGLAFALAVPHVPELARIFKQRGTNTGTLELRAVNGAVMVASGIAMLLRRNWGRLLYLLYSPVQYVLVLFLTRFSLMQLPRLAVYIVFLILLTRPKVNAFFADRAGPPAEAPPTAQA